jgi:hypothetical protein
MAGIASRDDFYAALGRSRSIRCQKASQTAEGAATWHSLWKAIGNPAAGSTPPTGNGAVPTRATAGAHGQPNATGGRYLYLLGLAAQGATVGTLLVYDRLWHNSAFDCNIATLQSIASPPTLPNRPDATGDGVELWGEFYTAPGATGATFTAVYTNEAGTGSRSATYTHPANAESVGQMVPFILQAGDFGVRTVASLQLSLGTGSVGDFGLVLLRPIAEIDITLVNTPNFRDVVQVGMPRIYDDACLAAQVFCSTTNTGFLRYSTLFGEN